MIRFKIPLRLDRVLCLLVLCLGTASLIMPAPSAVQANAIRVGNGTAASCTETALETALSAGGMISFDCGPDPVTITITSEKVISKDTTLDGGGTITLRGNGNTRILRSIDGTFTGSTVTKVINVTLQNIAIENGNTSDQGGGMRVGFWNNFTARNVQFRNNRSTKDDENCAGGGALFIGGGSTALIEQSTFSGNRANNGGGINSLRSNLTISDSHFHDNHATHSDRINQFPDCGGGGGVYIDGARNVESGGPSQTVIRRTVFSANTTNNHGAGLFVGLYTNESIWIDETYFEGNITSKAASKDSSGTGGAIWYGSATGSANNATFTLSNSTLANNRAVGQGGGLWTSAAATIRNVTFVGNRTEDTTISDVYNWRRGNGGALAVNNNAAVTVTNSSFANNYAGFNGGAIAGGSSLTVRNSLFVNNTGGNGWQIQQHCTNQLPGGNNLQYPNRKTNNWNDYNCGAGIPIVDPQLGTLADNGGPAPTLALTAGSPAIDAADSVACPGVDQRGVRRDQGAGCDIGAYERVVALRISPTFVAAGGASFTLNVTGDGFTAASRVLWNGVERPTTRLSHTLLQATISSADIASIGTAQISVSGSALPATSFSVIAEVTRVYQPLLRTP